ncbi:hypothetical protein [uncultured Jannaschia sp.]|uniref:hypothetical protein n=1 Tax=uncultured Jannaschia sp. TaxID=293347 RepID=UPI002625A28A|nr:hypothetical protein [uncultured Jannaschia sp.]
MTRNTALLFAGQVRMVELTTRFWSDMAMTWKTMLPPVSPDARALDRSEDAAEAATEAALRPIDGTLIAAADLVTRPDVAGLNAKDVTPGAR